MTPSFADYTAEQVFQLAASLGLRLRQGVTYGVFGDVPCACPATVIALAAGYLDAADLADLADLSAAAAYAMVRDALCVAGFDEPNFRELVAGFDGAESVSTTGVDVTPGFLLGRATRRLALAVAVQL